MFKREIGDLMATNGCLKEELDKVNEELHETKEELVGKKRIEKNAKITITKIVEQPEHDCFGRYFTCTTLTATLS